MKAKGTSFSMKHLLDCNGKTLDLSTPKVMGILNITPDSFYDGNPHRSLDEIIALSRKMINEGATMLDIGGLSTRPGAQEASKEEEWKRIEFVLKNLRQTFPETILSIDTFQSFVAERAIALGADMINDISGGAFDKKMPEIVATKNIPFVLMHIQGRPGNMQLNPEYKNLIEDIKTFFTKQIQIFKELAFDKIILDPGFGFGKTLEHNYSLLKNLKEFEDFGFPILAGLSRKSMINKVLSTLPSEALNGTTIVNTIALQNGAKILRVHDVKEAMEAIKIVDCLKVAP
jgi:dihydropteroate synthase